MVTASEVVTRAEKVPVYIDGIPRMTTDLRPGAASGPQPDGDEGPTKNRARIHGSAGHPEPGDYSPDGRDPTAGPDCQGKAGVSHTSAGVQPEPIHNRHLKVERL